jgi:hypothetical protein
MLIITINQKIYHIEELQSSYNGKITLYINTGGLRQATIGDERFLKIKKADSVKPHNEILIGQQKST